MRRELHLVSLVSGLSAALIACGPPPDEARDFETTVGALGTVPVRTNMQGYTQTNGSHAILFSTTNFNVMRAVGTPPAQRTFTNLGGAAFPSVQGIVRVDNVNAIYYVDMNTRHMHEIVNGQDVDFVSAVGAPPGGTNFAVYKRSDNRTALYYISDVNRHVIEVASNFGGNPAWLVGDLTAATGGAVTGGFEVFAYRRSDNKDAILFRAEPGIGRVHEIASNFGGSPAWIESDLIDAAGLTLTGEGKPWGYARSDGRNAVVFAGDDGKVHELTNDPGHICSANGKPWCHNIIATSSGFVGAPSAFVRWDGKNSVVYEAPAGVLKQSVLGNNGWVESTIGTTGNGTFFGGEPFAHRAPSAKNSILIRGDDFGIEFIQANGSSTWTQSIL